MAMLILLPTGVIAGARAAYSLMNHWVNTGQAESLIQISGFAALQLTLAGISPIAAAMITAWLYWGYIGDHAVGAVRWVDDDNPLPAEGRVRLKNALALAKREEGEALAIIGNQSD